MAQRLEQTQAAVQTQQLSSMQVAVAKLVELPITELATRVRDEMVDNAALEERDGDAYGVAESEHNDDSSAFDESTDGANDEAANDSLVGDDSLNGLLLLLQSVYHLLLLGLLTFEHGLLLLALI